MSQPASPNGRTIAMELKIIRRAVARIAKQPCSPQRWHALEQVHAIAEEAIRSLREVGEKAA